MTKALSDEKANAIKQELLEARENEALEELHKLGFRVSLHTMGRYVEADDLLGITAGYKPGDCYAVIYARDGRRKHITGTSAVQTLMQAQAWWRWQEGLKDDAANKFVPSVDHEPVPENIVTQRVSGDTATTTARRAATERRLLNFETGAPRLDAHGTPIHEANQASQYATSEGDTSR